MIYLTPRAGNSNGSLTGITESIATNRCDGSRCRMTTSNQSERVEVQSDQGQMRRVLSPQVPRLCPPHYQGPGSVCPAPHVTYHTLGHCLRTDIFPGAPLPWTSLVKDSYVGHPLLVPPRNLQPWYGRKTDDLVQWTERNIIQQKLLKALKEMETRGGAK